MSYNENYGFSGPVPPGISIRDNVDRAKEYQKNHSFEETMEWFYDIVRNNKDGHLSQKDSMDYKQINPIYADFGNFNFGVIGRILGIPALILEYGAGWAQGKADGLSWVEAMKRALLDPTNKGDNPGDQYLIKQGIDAANEIASPINNPRTWDDYNGNGLVNEFDPDMDGDGLINEVDPDIDNDGIPNEKDEHKFDPRTLNDIDGDGIANDKDNDMDGDGTKNYEDDDIDGDGLKNEADDLPTDPRTADDIDGDKLPNWSDPDRDGDGLKNEIDDHPDDPNDQPHGDPNHGVPSPHPLYPEGYDPNQPPFGPPDRGIDDIKDNFGGAERASSPLILDLDGDGVETTGVKSGAYFDHSGDGFAERTGWVGKDDGLLVLDRNNNGLIDSGAELFGDSTLLADGSKAANGFAALTELDSNLDGLIDARDAAFASLRIWKDADGDGYSRPDELLTLTEAGVQSIATASAASPLVDANGNAHKLTGSFTRTDGSTAAVSDVWFAVDRTHSIATEWLDVPVDIAALPNAKGYGQVRDLHQAMVRDQSGVLKSLVSLFVAAESVTERNALAEQIIYKWTGVDGLVIDSRGPYIDARKLASLEAFLSEEFRQRDIYSNPYTQASALLSGTFEGLKELVYGQLAAQTYLNSLYSRISYSYDDTLQGLVGNLSQIAAELTETFQADPEAGKRMLSEFARTLKGLGALGMMDTTGFLENLAPLGLDVVGIVDAIWKGLVPTGADDNLSGTSGSDYIRGLGGDDSLFGNAGNDTLAGGLGNDILDGGAGDDIYMFNPGDGVDIVNNYDPSGVDTVAFGQGIILKDLHDFKGLNNDLVFNVGSNGDQLTINNWFAGNAYQVERFSFADGTIVSGAELLADRQIPMASNQYLTGTSDDDTLVGDFAHDTLRGGDGDDVLKGALGDDSLSGDAGNDYLEGGGGKDNLNGGAGNDTYIFNVGDGADTINNYDTTGIDTVSFGAGIALADINLATKVGANLIFRIGSNGDQLTINNWFSAVYYQLDRFAFADGTVKSGAELLAGLPLYENGTTANDSLTGYEGVDIMTGNAGNDYLYGYAGNDTLSGGEGNDNLQAGDGDDLLDGGSGDDTLAGGNGNDLLTGGLGIDNLSGGTGDDTLTGGVGNDILDGGTGNDTYVFNLGDGADTINNYDTTGVDTVSFGAGIGLTDINLATKAGNNLVLGIGSNGDQLTINNWFSGAMYQLDHFVFADDTVKSGAELLAGLPMYENGTAANDSLTGYEGVDIMAGGEGNDTLYGYAGNDTLSGGEGNDNLQAGDGDDLLDGGSGDDTLAGGNGNDLLTGGLGIDNLSGGTGDDTLTGGVGNDILDGGTGNDTYVFNLGDGADTINNYDTTGVDTVSFGAGIGLTDINLATKAGNNLVLEIGSNGDQLTINNWFSGAMYQLDRFVFADDTIKSGAEILAGLPVYENGTAANDSLTGYEGVDIMTGYAGNDTLYGYAGNDTLSGGEGNDNLQAGDGDDLLDGGSGDDTLSGGNGNDLLTGGLGIDTLTGNAGNDTYIFNVGDGADTLNNYDTTGVDTLSFGAGIALADINLTKVGNNLILGIGSNSDQVTISNWYASAYYQLDRFSFADNTVLTNVELMEQKTVYGTASNDSFSGVGSINDRFDGGIGNDSISGNEGNDTLLGGVGDDSLNGGNGNDTLIGGTGNDTLTGGAGDDTFIFNLGDGQDTISADDVAGIDTLAFGTGITLSNLKLVKEGYDLLIKVGDGGDQLRMSLWYHPSYTGYRMDRFSFADNTVLTNVELMEQKTVYGTDGNDSFSGVGSINDWFNGGIGNDSISGNDGNDTLLGGVGDDSLNGGNGNDFLIGGAGTDTLTGGAGNDTFVFNTLLDQSTNKDTISDFTLGQDKIELDKTIFAALPDEGTLALQYFLANATGVAGDDNDYILYNTTSGALLYDADGNGQGVAIEFASLTNKPAIKAEDFLIAA